MTSARGDALPSVAPGLLLTLLSCWFGTLPGGATAAGSAFGCAAILLLALIGSPDWSDPLRLGRKLGSALPLALVIATTVSWALSPVSRAGQLGALLLPAVLLAPAGVARCWQGPKRLQNGLDTVSLAIVTIATWSLVDWLRLQTPRAAMPLGHHNLLAGWLVFLLPLAAVGLRNQGPRRWLSATALVGGAGAILATGSMLGVTALALQGALASVWWTSLRLPLASAAALAVLSQVPRGLGILMSTDVSAQARLQYLRAAWDGLIERPALGWGPGSTPWMIARFLKPDRAVNPPSQVVGDVHSLPAQLAFEVGLVGLTLSLALWSLFVARRWLSQGTVSNSPEKLAPMLGLVGGSLFLLGNAPLTVLALPGAAILTCGAALASEPSAAERGHRTRLFFTLGYLLPVGVLLLPKLVAQVHYDRAATAESSAHALEEIERARILDPSFPLYGARKAWLQGAVYGIDEDSANLALLAADSAKGVAPLWLAAGFMGLQVSADWAFEALSTASRLDPLSPLPPFLMALSRPTHPEAAQWAAHAVRLEPRLSHTSRFLDSSELRRRTKEVLQAPGGANLPLAQSDDGRFAPPGTALGLTMDRKPSLALSLYAFRRRPWPATLVRLPLGR